MSFTLYANYIKERRNHGSIHDDHGFVTFDFLPNNICHLIDIYVDPICRITGVGKSYLKRLIKIAKENKSSKIIATIDLKAKNHDLSLTCALKTGFKIVEAKNDILIVALEI